MLKAACLNYNRHFMDTARITGLLQPFLAAPLTPGQLGYISTYIDLLLHWNARVNLTAVRDAEHIVTRHFGESLFAARHLFPGDPTPADCADLGSGAGFPGLPIKIWAPHVKVTLIESNHKKATFLREVIRTLALKEVNVFAGRGEDLPAASASVVTLRAVEGFEKALAVAAKLARPGGRLALLIGTSQADRARHSAPTLAWQATIPIPLSEARILLIAEKLE
jgi:16S rRNA (guanine527-N7)-methyltransferase